jgi:hypothetical protein
MITIKDKITEIIKKLGIDDPSLLLLIETKLGPKKDEPIDEQSDLFIKINKLLEGDNMINNFGSRLGDYSTRTKDNFNKLKQNLGKLQVLVLMKKIEKTSENEEILNLLFEALNNKLGTVNNMLASNYNMLGGGINNEANDFYKKYHKYKIKYMELYYKNIINSKYT